MLLKFVIGFVTGGAISAARGSSVSLAIDAPILDAIMDPAKDVVPVRAVIVGGGYSGARLAYQLDSIFDLTYIDEKNFYELTNDVIPVISNPWDDEKHPEACRRMTALHRYYLKRANVLTGTVDGVDEKQVYLRDGRTIPFDVLFVATGERKPFPFRTEQRTLSGRVKELKHFNKFLQASKKVAVVGGGPVGTSLAHDLATSRPDLEVHLYHSRGELLPALPGVCRRYTLDKLEASRNMHVHLSHRVTAVEGIDQNGKLIPEPAVDIKPPSPQGQNFWGRWFTSSAHLPEPTKYNLHYDVLQYERKPQQSIIHQIYFGKQDGVAESGEVNGSDVEGGFDYVFPCAGDTPRPIPVENGKPNILKEHEMPDGHYRISTLSQFFGLPYIFACGRCTNLPVVHGYGSSDVQSRTLFRAINSVINNPTTSFMHARDGLQLPRMQVPRLHVRLGVDDAVGCTPWSGGMTGVSAVHEFMQDRNYLMKDFLKPTFFKQQDQAKIKRRIDDWKAHEITDIVDFSHA